MFPPKGLHISYGVTTKYLLASFSFMFMLCVLCVLCYGRELKDQKPYNIYSSFNLIIQTANCNYLTNPLQYSTHLGQIISFPISIIIYSIGWFIIFIKFTNAATVNIFNDEIIIFSVRLSLLVIKTIRYDIAGFISGDNYRTASISVRNMTYPTFIFFT